MNRYKDNLVYFRRKSGITQEELANRTGITQSIIAKYETGKRNISIENALKIAKALNISVEELFESNEPYDYYNNPNTFNSCGLSIRLKKLREETRFTQEKAAEVLNVSRETYNTIESGKRRLKDYEIVKLAVLYGTTTDYILRGKIDKTEGL